MGWLFYDIPTFEQILLVNIKVKQEGGHEDK